MESAYQNKDTFWVDASTLGDKATISAKEAIHFCKVRSEGRVHGRKTQPLSDVSEAFTGD